MLGKLPMPIAGIRAGGKGLKTGLIIGWKRALTDVQLFWSPF